MRKVASPGDSESASRLAQLFQSAVRVVARSKTAALEGPPATTKAIVDHVQKFVSGYIIAHSEDVLVILRKALDEEKAKPKSRKKSAPPSMVENFTDRVERKEALIEAARKYSPKKVSIDAKIDLGMIPLDLSGWKYPKPKSDLPDTVTLLIHLEGAAPFGAASWKATSESMPSKADPSLGLLNVYASSVKLREVNTPADLSKVMARLETAVEHECRHMAQDLLSWVTGVPGAGLPPGSKSRTEPVDPWKNPEEYHLTPQEFHPMVDSMIREFKLKLEDVPKGQRRRELNELIRDQPSLKVWEKRKPDWWRRAVREIQKQIEV